VASYIFDRKISAMSKIILLSGFYFCSVLAFSQGITVTGVVSDSLSHKGLSYATVSLIKARDSTLTSFSRADSAGNFKITKVEKGSYLVSASYVGYTAAWKAFYFSGEQSHIDLGTVFMNDLKTLGEMDVRARRAPVTINNDTLEFNSENFKTQPNAVVENMLRKMPGFTIDNDGTIRLNGQMIRGFGGMILFSIPEISTYTARNCGAYLREDKLLSIITIKGIGYRFVMS
jgi:Carboxypeptidase regulatory-like domain